MTMLSEVPAEVGAIAEASHEILRKYGKRRNVPFAELTGSETSEAIFFAQAYADAVKGSEAFLQKHKDRIAADKAKAKASEKESKVKA